MADLAPIILVTVLLLIVAIGIIVLVLVYQKRQLQYVNEKEQLKANFDKEIMTSKLEIQEQTMKNISQEIHDNIGQVLSVVRLNINTMNGNDRGPQLQEKIMNTSELVGKVIQDLRDLSKSLDSYNITEKGLVKAVEYEIDLLKKTGVYTAHLSIKGEPYDIPEQKELILFRIFQEVINNIIKHAGATLVEVCISFQPQKFLLQINDNGHGFDINGDNKNHGAGLRNMQNRSRLIGAFYNIDSGPGRGTSVKIELPVFEYL